MKTAESLVLACLTGALFTSGCNYTKPVMYIDIANHSGHSMVNVELKHPTGTFGLPELRNEQTHRHMAPIGTPCKFSVAFEDQASKKYAQTFDLGVKCPVEISFDVGPEMSVSERQVRP